jgi:hypothetical protein
MLHKSNIEIKALLAICGFMAVCGLGMCDVVINEFELSPPSDGTVWVEVYNTGNATVDLTGWKINIVDTPWEGLIPLKGSIGPKGFVAFDGQDTWTATGNGTVFLYDASGAEVDKTPLKDDNTHSDFTYGRIPDGKNTDTDGDFAFMMASKGRSNVR